MSLSLSNLRPTAKSFTPGALGHTIKRITWHPIGITRVRHFAVVPDEAMVRGRKTPFTLGLHKTHGVEDSKNPRNSKIRDANPYEAAPFKIPPYPDEFLEGLFTSYGPDDPDGPDGPYPSSPCQSNVRNKDDITIQIPIPPIIPDYTCTLSPLVRQKSQNRSFSDGSLCFTRKSSDQFIQQNIDDYISWIGTSETMTPGIKSIKCTSTMIKYVDRYNYCDN